MRGGRARVCKYVAAGPCSVEPIVRNVRDYGNEEGMRTQKRGDAIERLWHPKKGVSYLLHEGALTCPNSL